MSLGQLVVSLAVNTAQFAADMGKAAHEAAKNMEHMKKEAEKAGKAIGAMFAAGVGVAGLLVKQSIDSADALYKLSQQTGVAIGTLSELQYVANLSGVSLEQLTVSIGKLNKNIAEAARGEGEAKRAFDALGISVVDAEGKMKTADEVMAEVADKFKGMEDGAAKTGLAMMIFGKSGASMIPMLNQGSDGMNRLREEARALGATLTEEVGKQAEELNDNLSRLNQVKKGLANQITAAVLPALTSFTNDIIDAAKNTDMMQTAATAAANGMKMLMTAVIAISAGFRIAGDAVGKLFAAIGLAAEGEFSAAYRLLAEDSGDMASVVEQAVKSIDNVWNATAQTAPAAAEEVAKKTKGPILKSAEEIAKAKREEEKLLADAAKSWVKYAEDVFEAAEAELKMMADMQAAREKLAEMVERQVGDPFLTDEQREEKAHADKLALLEKALQEKAITQERYNELIYLQSEAHEARMLALQQKHLTAAQRFTALSYKDQAKTIFGELANITAGVAQHNKALFEINKVAGIANAIINAYEGISLTMSKYPYPLNIAMAAMHGVAAFAQVQAIRSQSFGGGGGAAPSLAGSTAAAPVSVVNSGTPEPLNAAEQAQTAPKRYVIEIHGSRMHQDVLEQIATGLQELDKDGFPAIFEATTK